MTRSARHSLRCVFHDTVVRGVHSRGMLMRLGRISLFSVLQVVAIVLALAGAILIGTYLYLRRHPELPARQPQDVWSVVDVDAIYPPLALRPLAGEASIDSVQAALSIDDLDTAYAMLASTPAVSDEERIGHLLLLARRYMDVNQEHMVTSCLEQAHSLIVLSPLLSDATRADAALQAAAVWLAAGDEEGARFSLAQAEVVVEQSARLRPALRQALWLRVADSYEELQDEQKAASVRNSANRRHSEPTGGAPTPLLSAFLGSLPISEGLQELQDERQQRAVALIDQWVALEGGDVGPEAGDLAEFLYREDAARLAYLDQVVAGSPELAVQAAAACERASWLTLKYRVARAGLGFSLMPDWEEDAPLIRSQLTKAYEDLFRLYGDEATALPIAHDVDHAWVALLRQEVLLGHLGLYPDYPEDQLLEKLDAAQQRALSTGGPGIRVSWHDDAGHRVYTLESASSQ